MTMTITEVTPDDAASLTGDARRVDLAPVRVGDLDTPIAIPDDRRQR